MIDEIDPWVGIPIAMVIIGIVIVIEWAVTRP